ncbi:MAG: DnaJ domain-containing protein [Clostridia bacterium]|nr:DnaJ domain-containing protein [Clostridia bacterium]
MNNPYKTLGISEDASDSEIRAAYLKLVKKYHPDKYTDPDLKAIANEKIIEINEAYEILSKRSANNSANDFRWKSEQQSAYSGTGGAYSGAFAAEFARARTFISQNNFQAAKSVLDAIGLRNAEWFYLYGMIYLRQGWDDKAREFITTAYQQEPSNPEYAAAYNVIKSSGSPYSRSSNNRNNGGGCSTCDVCSGILCADCCCECMGGDLVRCC